MQFQYKSADKVRVVALKDARPLLAVMQFVLVPADTGCIGISREVHKAKRITLIFIINDYSSLDALPSATAFVIYFFLIPLGKE